MACEHYYISGRVQGVFYRASAYEVAQSLNLTGWVKNLPDGRVEVVACGNIEQLVKLKAWLKKGPPMAKVQQLEVTDINDGPELIDGFEIRY
jgi:acylphosphatase